MPESPELSKNAQKKAKRLEKIKEQRKANRKLKKQLAKTNKQNSNTKSENPENHVSKKTLKLQTIEKLQNALENGAKPKICIDLQYEQFMNEKELVHLARQLSRVYGANKKSEDPCHLTFCNLPQNSKTHKICSEKNDGFANYILNFSEKPLIETFLKEEIVYLSPDSNETLEEIDESKVYVIGGLVDDSVKKSSTLTFAKEQNIKSVKLPIDKYCSRADQGSFKQILTINQVFEILLNKSRGLTWPQAFSQSLPNRIGFLSNNQEDGSTEKS